jgi:hypothetical protein
VLEGLSTAGGEQHMPESVWGDLDDQPRRFPADVGRMAGGECAEQIGLLLDSRDDPRMLVAQICEDQLGAEVQVTAAVGIDDVATGAANEGADVARTLHCPGMKDQLVAIHGDLGQGRLPQDWMSVKVVPHLPGSANSSSACPRSEASSFSLSISSSRDSSAMLN